MAKKATTKTAQNNALLAKKLAADLEALATDLRTVHEMNGMTLGEKVEGLQGCPQAVVDEMEGLKKKTK